MGIIATLMTNREIRGLMEWSARLHLETQRACEQSRADGQRVLEALNEFKRSAGLRDLGMTQIGSDRQVTAPVARRDLKPQPRAMGRGRLRTR
jgi:hypothetical protein